MTDIVYIKGLQVQTIIGIFDWEREVKQIVCIDLEMATDISMAAKTDDIQYALNYKDVAKRIIAYVQTRQALLVESLAEEVAALVLNEFNVSWLRLRLGKPGALRDADDVGLIIERGVKTNITCSGEN